MTSLAQLCVSQRRRALSYLQGSTSTMSFWLSRHNSCSCTRRREGEKEKGTIWLQFCYVATHGECAVPRAPHPESGLDPCAQEACDQA